MRKHDYFQNDPWNSDSYETGSTEPPKNHRGIIAVLLISVIFLGGIISAMGAMNFRLAWKLREAEKSAMTFTEGAQGTLASTGNSGSTVDKGSSQGTLISVDLSPTPDSVENVAPGGLPYQEIYEKAIPSVVSITCQLRGGSSSGTGVVLAEEGYIVTNWHVVEGAQSIEVRLSDDRELEAWVVAQDAVSDLAVIYVEAQDLIPAEFGDSGKARVGDAVAAIGDPLGAELRGTMTDGIISAINRDVTVSGRSMTLIQTNAALNSGNSGGPLLNCYGQVIGINTMKISTFVDDAGVEGIGFAIPSVTVKEVVDQLLSQGYVSGRPGLGIQGDTVSSFDQRFNRIPGGFLISAVEEGSCAEAAGITEGDVLMYLGTTRIESSDDLKAAIYGYNAGDTVEVTLYRYRTGNQFTVTLTLDEAVE